MAAPSTRDRIERAALELFVERGKDGTSVRDIAEGAGISEGAIYRHFPSKEALALQLFESNFHGFTARIDLARQQHARLEAQLRAMIHAFCIFFDRDPVLFSYLLLTQHDHLKNMVEEDPHPLLLFRDAIAEGIARGEIPERDPMVAASMVVGLVLQTAVSRIYDRYDYALSALAEEIAGAAWRVLEA